MIIQQLLQAFELAKTSTKAAKKPTTKKLAAKKAVTKAASKKTGAKKASTKVSVDKEEFSTTSTTKTVPKNYMLYVALDKPIKVTDVQKRSVSIPVDTKFGFRSVWVNDKSYYVLKVDGSKDIFHVTTSDYYDITRSKYDNNDINLANVISYPKDLEKVRERRAVAVQREAEVKKHKKEETPFDILDVRSGKSFENDGITSANERKKSEKAFKNFTDLFAESNAVVSAQREQRQCLKAYKAEAFTQINEYLRYGEKGDPQNKNQRRKNKGPLSAQTIEGMSYTDKYIEQPKEEKKKKKKYTSYKDYLKAKDDPNLAEYTVAEAVQHLDAAFEHYSLPNDVVVGRAVNATKQLKAAMQIGAVIQDKGYMSTTMSKSALSNFASEASLDSDTGMLLQIKVPKGTRAIPMATENWPPPQEKTGDNTQECELLLPRNQQFRITGMSTRQVNGEDTTVYDAELIT